jgi:hypothetical protein
MSRRTDVSIFRKRFEPDVPELSVFTLNQTMMVVGFSIVICEFLIEVVMKRSLFQDITLCSPLKINLRFGGTCHFHFQGPRIGQAKTRMTRAAVLSSFLLGIFFDIEGGGGRFLRTSVDFQRMTRRYIPEDRTHGFFIFTIQSAFHTRLYVVTAEVPLKYQLEIGGGTVCTAFSSS